MENFLGVAKVQYFMVPYVSAYLQNLLDFLRFFEIPHHEEFLKNFFQNERFALFREQFVVSFVFFA